MCVLNLFFYQRKIKLTKIKLRKIKLRKIGLRKVRLTTYDRRAAIRQNLLRFVQ